MRSRAGVRSNRREQQRWFEESWIRIGAISALGGALNLTETIGRYRALELLLSGRRITATEATRLGLVNKAVSDIDLDDAIYDLAAAIATTEPEAVRAMKRVVRAGDGIAFGEALRVGAELQSGLLSRPEFAVHVAELLSGLLRRGRRTQSAFQNGAGDRRIARR